MTKLDVIYDLETADPDDAFTLCLLACHSKVNLRAVTITPGAPDQVKLVSKLLQLCETDPNIPVGVRALNYPKSCVSDFHYRWLGPAEKFDCPIKEAQSGYEVLHQTLQQYPGAILLTGASLGNPRLLLENYPETQIAHWVGQGGFAGDQVVPEPYRLAKFAGRNTCPTFNFNGDIPGARLLLSSPNVKLRHLVSKNVCHGVVYDLAMHQKVQETETNSPIKKLLLSGMGTYLEKRPTGKLFHDPLAACTLINPEICEFREVEVYREKGEWGSKLQSDTRTFISIKYDPELFFQTLLDL